MIFSIDFLIASSFASVSWLPDSSARTRALSRASGKLGCDKISGASSCTFLLTSSASSNCCTICCAPAYDFLSASSTVRRRSMKTSFIFRSRSAFSGSDLSDLTISCASFVKNSSPTIGSEMAAASGHRLSGISTSASKTSSKEGARMAFSICFRNRETFLPASVSSCTRLTIASRASAFSCCLSFFSSSTR